MHGYHHHFLHFLKNRELNELYASIGIRAFAFALTGVFIPIFLFQQGFSFTSIFLFYGLLGLFTALFSLFSVKIFSRFGLKHCMLISMPFLIAFFAMLYTLETMQWPLLALSVIYSISAALFWVPYHIDFSKFSSKKDRAKQVGYSKIAASAFAVLGPGVGGLILALSGFHILFIIVAILLLGSIVPLFLTKEVHEPLEFSLKDFFQGQKLKEVIGFMSHGAEMRLGWVVWPLFIFIFILGEKYVSLGVISSIACLSGVIFIFLAGKLSDIKRRKKVMRFGAVVNTLVWIAKSFIITPLQVIIAEIFYGASQATTHVPFDAIAYDRARKRNVPGMIIQREFYIHLGIFIMFMLLILFVNSLTEMFRYGGSISSLLRLFF
jgi:MFS family permease